MPIILRDYQDEAEGSVYHHLQTRNDNPCVVIPCGGGKTQIIASICNKVVRNWGGRILCLSHVKELLVQLVEKLLAIDSTLPVGLYSAGLGIKQTHFPVTVAGIHSIWQKAFDFPPFDLIIIDEVQMCPIDGDGMYLSFLKDAKIVNPDVRIVGFTATEFRLDCGMICSPDAIMNYVCHRTEIKELIHRGYLSPLKTRDGKVNVDLSNVHVRGGEYIPAEMASAFDTLTLVDSACREILEQSTDRMGILVFASSIEHGLHVKDKLIELGEPDVEFVSSESSTSERDRILCEFKNRKFRTLVNVGIAGVGFDAPHIDCIALLRSTKSPGLLYQFCGRGFRISPGKSFCRILDFGSNIKRLGTIDNLRIVKSSGDGSGEAPVKTCPECQELIHAVYSVCPFCGFSFPLKQPKHDARAGNLAILSGDVSENTMPVRWVRYGVHIKSGTVPGEAPPTLRVTYGIGQFVKPISEWVCIEHKGFAQAKARRWWSERTRVPFPATVSDAVNIGKSGGLTAPETITVRAVSGSKFPNIVGYGLGPAFEPGDAWEINTGGELDENAVEAAAVPF